MPSRQRTSKTYVDIWISRAVSVFTILAIAGGLYGYFSSQHDKRVEKTFEFYKSFRTDPLRKDFALLISRWNEAADKAKPLLDQEKDDQLSVLIISLVSDKDGGEAFSHIADFFEELNSCVEHSLCDRNSAVALLKDSADEFIEPYGAYIAVLRKTYSNETIGAGVYKVRSMKTEWSPF
jgi:hypothetical protein